MERIISDIQLPHAQHKGSLLSQVYLKTEEETAPFTGYFNFAFLQFAFFYTLPCLEFQMISIASQQTSKNQLNQY